MADTARSAVAAGVAEELPLSLLPGFRFYPTDQELVVCFLTRKVLGLRMELDIIPMVDHCRFEPHELPAKSFSPSTGDPGAKVVCYFFAPRGRKYPTGLRIDRATVNGFWKSTGKDRPVMQNGTVVGMKKTLVFHAGRAPKGTRTDWVMHEYRLHGHHIQDRYALCPVFNKKTVTPSTDVSSGADVDEDPMHFVPGGFDMNPDLMEYMFDGTNSGNDPKQSMLGGVKTDKYPMEYMSSSTNSDKNPRQFMLGRIDSEYDPMKSVLRAIGTDNDPIQVESESNSPTANNDLMHFLLDGVGTDKDHIQVESNSDYAIAGNGGVQFLSGGGDKGKGREQVVTDRDITEKGGTNYVTVDMEKEDAGTNYVDGVC
ncbi:NAC domain-containing protein 100-like [Triticum dicoccoides]|uniref:NAC domain-containing protein 100-like n=1 Tax=Triticum dicoccoides TaxID=85692 RepID=UPI00188EE664|nr:NAC domain-containing protein 100-like [Triticum dicoccoides]XP_037471244.1 NAC domain-containing protein 100-like [Triticum dicoccoides]